MNAALVTAECAMREFHGSPIESNLAGARAAIARLDEVLNEHLTHEERDLEPFAAAHMGAPEMKKAQSAVRKAHRGTTGTFAAWLLDGADADTVAALRREIPRPALFVMTRLPGCHYRRDIAPVWQSA